MLSGDGFGRWALDPFEDDRLGDMLVTTTRRRMHRVAIVAADAGARFAREGSATTGAAWMATPRVLFDGSCGLEACQNRDAFVRATLLHGLALSLDAHPEEIDALLNDGHVGMGMDTEFRSPPHGKPRLHTAVIEGRVGNGERRVQAFCAMIEADEAAVRERLSAHYGRRLAERASIMSRFDERSSIARALLSSGLRRKLAVIAADPTAEDAEGLDLHVVQWFTR